jgi:hypothetical protein
MVFLLAGSVVDGISVKGSCYKLGLVQNQATRGCAEWGLLSVARHRGQLAGIRIGIHDEIFPVGHPVLVGLNAASTTAQFWRIQKMLGNVLSQGRPKT